MKALIALLLNAFSCSALACQTPTPDDNYQDLFASFSGNDETQFRQDLKKTKDSESIEKFEFNEKTCQLTWPVHIHDTNFIYDQKAGGLVKSIYMPEAYGLFKKGDTAGIR